MFYQFRILVILLLGLILLEGCKKESLRAIDSQPQYHLPQGNHPFDQRIVDFYNKYGTYILYQFSEIDFRWNYSNKIYYLAKQADPAYVEKALNFLDKELFSYYKPEQLKNWMPYKILLCKEILELDQGQLPQEIPFPGVVDAVWAQSHIAFGHADARWDSFSVKEKKAVRANMHAVFLASAIARKKIEIPSDFTMGLDYTTLTPSNYKTFGTFEPVLSVQEDVRRYVSRITQHTKAELEILYFNPEFDPTGIYRQKYDALVSFFKTKYNVDLQSLGTSGLH